jgi:hypothetical protein
MTDQMLDDQFDIQLRQFLALQATDTAGAPSAAEMATRLSARAKTANPFGLSPQLIWIVLAALLMAAIAGAAVAAALLLRNDQAILPAPTLSPSPTAPAGTLTAMDDPLLNYCGSYPKADLPVQFVVRTSQPSFDETILLVLPDGTVLSGKRSDLRFGAGMQQRRLTDAGLDDVTDLVFAADLPDCQEVTFGTENEDGWLVARTGTDQVTALFGSNGLRIRQISAAEAFAMADLAEQLLNLDDTLDPSSWRDAAWQPYLPDDWKLTIGLATEEAAECGLNAPPTSAPVPSTRLRCPADEKLPTGRPLLNFGTLYPAIALRLGGYQTAYRCGFIDATLAAAVPEALGLEPGLYGQYGRLLQPPDPERLSVFLTAQLPGDRGCEGPEPPAPIGAPPSDLAPAVDACALITGAIEGAGTGAKDQIVASTDGGAGWWSGCYAEVAQGNIQIAVRGRRTTAADGASYASSLLGAGVTSARLSGRTIYWNDCFGADSGCNPAVVIESEPHLIVISGLGQNREDFRAMLEAAAENGVLP